MSRQPQGSRCWQALSNGLDAVAVLFCLLEFCTAVAALAFGCSAVRSHSYTRMVSGTTRPPHPPCPPWPGHGLGTASSASAPQAL